jgi:two-component system, CAI-1 autoinducer sensor kinase/phosphatase CqsS
VAFSALGLFGSHYYQRGISIKSPKFGLPVIGWRGILNFSEGQVRTHGHNYFLAGGLGIMYFISSVFLYNPHSTSGMLLAVRAISAVLALGLLFHERIGLKASHQKYLALYYHIVLMAIFPLISGYMMFLTGFSAFWVMSFALAIIMMNFVCGITMTALLTPLGLLGAHILWKKSGAHVLPIPASMVHIGFTAILLVITARVRHNFQRSMIEMKEMYSTMLAHQVMQPIAQVSMVAGHASSILAPHVQNEDLQEVAKQLASLEKIGHKGTELVNGLLMMSRDDIEKAQDRGAYYIQDVINTALLTYSEKQLSRIKLDKSKDFRFNGSKMFMVEVIRNLISNSFKYAGPKAEIEIYCGPRALYIRDNGRGIEQERLPYIFDHTRNAGGQSTGTGFGLAFVKRVVDTFNCSIICRSELAKYTEFVIAFPRL